MDSVDYFIDPLSPAKLRDLIRKMGVPVQTLLRTKDPAYAELNLGSGTRSDEELIRLMIEHPGLLQRPIVEKGSRAILARPPERLKEIL